MYLRPQRVSKHLNCGAGKGSFGQRIKFLLEGECICFVIPVSGVSGVSFCYTGQWRIRSIILLHRSVAYREYLFVITVGGVSGVSFSYTGRWRIGRIILLYRSVAYRGIIFLYRSVAYREYHFNQIIVLFLHWIVCAGSLIFIVTFLKVFLYFNLSGTWQNAKYWLLPFPLLPAQDSPFSVKSYPFHILKIGLACSVCNRYYFWLISHFTWHLLKFCSCFLNLFPI